MAPETICRVLKEAFSTVIVDAHHDGIHPHVVVEASRWPEVALFLRDDPRLQLNLLRSITALDLLAENQVACVYDLMAITVGHDSDALITEMVEFAVRVVVDRDDPHIPSVAHVWPAADWHEREAYDMMGITFDGHPDHRRILCPDDWVGYPLRKDYEFPLEYHDIPGTTEYELPNPFH